MAEGAAVDAPYAKLDELEPGIARVLAHNPSAFTYYGTQTYLIGTPDEIVGKITDTLTQVRDEVAWMIFSTIRADPRQVDLLCDKVLPRLGFSL